MGFIYKSCNSHIWQSSCINILILCGVSIVKMCVSLVVMTVFTCFVVPIHFMVIRESIMNPIDHPHEGSVISYISTIIKLNII
jgi:hypothetical protein